MGRHQCCWALSSTVKSWDFLLQFSAFCIPVSLIWHFVIGHGAPSVLLSCEQNREVAHLLHLHVGWSVLLHLLQLACWLITLSCKKKSRIWQKNLPWITKPKPRDVNIEAKFWKAATYSPSHEREALLPDPFVKDWYWHDVETSAFNVFLASQPLV